MKNSKTILLLILSLIVGILAFFLFPKSAKAPSIKESPELQAIPLLKNKVKI